MPPSRSEARARLSFALLDILRKQGGSGVGRVRRAAAALAGHRSRYFSDEMIRAALRT